MRKCPNAFVGVFTWESALSSGRLLLLLALGMTAGTAITSALNASVPFAAAGAFALSFLGPGSLTLDRLWRDRRREGGAA